MSKRLVTLSMICLILALSGCSTQVVDGQQVARNERIVIKFSHVVDENTPKGMAAKRFADLVRVRSGGNIEVQVFPNSQLYKDGEELDALKRGDIQILAPATSKLSEMFPRWQVLDLPYAFPDLKSVHVVLDGPVGKELFAELPKQNLFGLAVWDNGFKQITNNRRQLLLPEDFLGLRFRVMSSKVLQEQFKALGAEGLPMPFNDVYDALAVGSVDGEENTISNIYTQKFDQVQGFLTLSNHGYLGYVVITNAEFWRNLPPWARKILEESLAEVSLWEREKALDLNQSQLAALKKQGKVKIDTLGVTGKQAWQKSFASVYTRLENDIGPDLIRAVMQQRTPGE